MQSSCKHGIIGGKCGLVMVGHLVRHLPQPCRPQDLESPEQTILHLELI